MNDKPETMEERHPILGEALRGFAEDLHKTAVEKGWWTDRNNDRAILLFHAEISEAVEAMRTGNPPSEKIPEFSSFEEELADVIIRILDHAQGNNLNVIDALVAKAAYNTGRPYKHGGKEF